jgi:phenylacetate-CoA ligase
VSFLLYVKKHLTTLPFIIGSPISKIPYEYRVGLGKIYRNRTNEIETIGCSSIEAKKTFIFNKVQSIAVYSNKNIPFYSSLYKSAGVNPERFTCFDDLTNLPIITKGDLQKVDILERSCPSAKSYIVNTGGSSGKPLNFYIEPSSIGHEWAHMHKVWEKVRFKPSDLRIVFAGRSDVNDVIIYDSARHQINVDIYAGWQLIADKLLTVYNKYKPKYLHGYPSSIFDFVSWLDDNKHPLLDILKGNINGLLLGSEYPSPQIRANTERLLNCKSISWYGHTERSVLAYEAVQYRHYMPFETYGHSEAVLNNGNHNLISTNYYNLSSPLIRYDTEDIIKPELSDGLLKSFEISEGRSGEFIIDKHGNKIFLTALIFGRHHALFNISNHIQIQQKTPGIATVYYVLRSGLFCEQPETLFDCDNVNLTFLFEQVEKPTTTMSGKIPLLIK